MTSLNKYAKEAMDRVGHINSVTDITGFGLLGHAFEMAKASNVSLIINSKDIPLISNVVEYASMGLVPQVPIAIGISLEIMFNLRIGFQKL